MHYSVQPRDRIFVRGYGFYLLPKKIGKNIGKNIIKKLSSKYSQKLLDHAKESAAYALKTASKKQSKKKQKQNFKMTKISETSQQNNSETITNEHDKGIPKLR